MRSSLSRSWPCNLCLAVQVMWCAWLQNALYRSSYVSRFRESRQEFSTAVGHGETSIHKREMSESKVSSWLFQRSLGNSELIRI